MHNPKVAEWVYLMMNDIGYYEQWRFKDTIEDYIMIIQECQQLYNKTPVTSRLTRATCLSTMKRAERDLEKVLSQYEEFKRYKQKTAISK